ncbi:MAG: hypothetical protein AB8B49_03125 [Nitratireductor sp.]
MEISKRKHLSFTSLFAALFIFTSCQSDTPASTTGALTLTSKDDAKSTIVAIAKAAQTCWFKSKDPAFKTYRLATEVNSHSGRPRILLVPKNKPSGLPKLVIEGQTQNARTTINAFGPLLSGALGARINQDVQRWAIGKKDCKA